jgi:GT2 family glycosyltransferase
MNASIDVVLVTQNRPELLRRCLRSLGEAAAACEIPVSLRICCNGGFVRSAVQIEELVRGLAFEKVDIEIVADSLSAGAARNRLLGACRANWIFFIDDDAFVEPDFFNRFRRATVEWPGADAVGGPNLTPPDSTPFQHASGAVLGSRFAAAKSAARYARRPSSRGVCGEAELISCNLFVRREALTRLRFAETLVSGEENWLMQDLKAHGWKLVYEAELFVWHERRRNFRQFLKQIHRYGVGRGQSGRLRPHTLRWFHLTPAAALLAPVLLLFSGAGGAILSLTAAYFLLWSIATWKVSRRNAAPARVGVLSALLFPCIHVAYGAGLLRGLAVRI